MTDDTRQKLLLFTNHCDSIRKKLAFGTSSVTPLNFEEEQQKFFSSSTYNPVFYYRPYNLSQIDHDIKDLRSELSTLKIPRDLRYYLLDYIQNLRLLEKARKSIGNDDFGYYAKKLFQFEFNAHDILRTLPVLNFNESQSARLYTAPEIAAVFEHVLLQQYGLSNFTVRIDHTRKHVIWTSNNTINIGCGIKRFERNVQRLIVHEIESHALQFHNLSLCNHPFIRLTKYRETSLYSEGLAVYNEIKTNTITKKAFEDYVYRLQAVGMLDKSFRQIYNYLSSLTSEKRAYMITYRVKRGMKNTIRSGGFPKDAAYLLGYKKIVDHINAGLRPEFLYITKTPYLTALLLQQNLLNQMDIKLPHFTFASSPLNRFSSTPIMSS